MKLFQFKRSAERDPFAIPRSVQRSIPIKRIYKDGIFEVSGKFSKTWRFFDVNYKVASLDKQMELFMEVCRMKDSGLEYLGDDDPKYHQGDRVRVIDGIFKGFEGHIKRIRHDRKLIVTIEGVAAFATGYIPPSMLEKVE